MSQFEITPPLLNDLRRKAEAYTEDGEWEFSPAAGEIKTLTGDVIVQDSHAENKNMSFIAAANPAVMLALVAEIERLRDRLEDLVCSGCDQQPKFCSCNEHPEASNADQA